MQTIENGCVPPAALGRYPDAVDAACRAERIDAVVVCPTYMFGPYDIKPSSGQIVVALSKGQIPTTTSGCQNIVGVRGLARGMLVAGEGGRQAAGGRGPPPLPSAAGARIPNGIAALSGRVARPGCRRTRAW